jgi:isopentenyl-diphosphate Delta-isomerase
MPASERVDLVDGRDRVVGSATLGECLARGLLHRAVATAVSDGEGRVLLQRRSLRDAWHPGRWTLSSTGHVRSGESYAAAAKRELREELGLGCALRPVWKAALPRMKGGNLTELEIVTLFVGTTSETPTPDPAEVEDVRPFERGELKSLMRGRKLTPDAKLLLKEYLSLVGNEARPG